MALLDATAAGLGSCITLGRQRMLMNKPASRVVTRGFGRLPNPQAHRENVPAALQAHSENVPGALIAGKYRLQWPLGEGGMGSVWLAHNVYLDTPVALKRILPGMQDEQTRQQLSIEARVVARLKHPGIVRVFDFGHTEGGDAFIVMEVLEGINLGQLLAKRGRLEPIEAVQLILPIVDALRHAHASGVVHRDLKPENIFLDRVGRETHPKLLDFGIAKLTREPSSHHTQGGQVMGSPAYMAPEQARGDGDVDHRADIWGICVVLYEAVSGTLAFARGGDVAHRSVIDHEIEPLEGRHAGEDTLWPILKRGLRKDRERRFQSMRELGTALAGWLTNRGETEDLHGDRLSRTWGNLPDRGDTPALEDRRPTATEPLARRREVMLVLAAAAAFAVTCLPAEGRPVHPAAIPTTPCPPATRTVAVSEASHFVQPPTWFTRTRYSSWAPPHPSGEPFIPSRRRTATRTVKPLPGDDLGLEVPH